MPSWQSALEFASRLFHIAAHQVRLSSELGANVPTFKEILHFSAAIACLFAGACGQSPVAAPDAATAQISDADDAIVGEVLGVVDAQSVVILDISTVDGAAAADGQAVAEIFDSARVLDVAAADAAIPVCVQSLVPTVVAPSLFWNGDKAALLARVKSPPFASIWADLQATAASNPGAFSGASSLYVRGNVAKAAALVGIVLNDLKLQKPSR